jgi:hypothetical protein
MRIALTLGFCLVSFAATAAPHSKGDTKPDANGPVPAQGTRENYRSCMSDSVVTMMAVASSTASRKFSLTAKICASSRRDVAEGRRYGVTQANIGQAVNLGGEGSGAGTTGRTALRKVEPINPQYAPPVPEEVRHA